MALNAPFLEQSFALVAPTEAAKQACGRECYTTLLRLHPEVEPLFAQTNMQEQARKLMATLALVLHVLKKPAGDDIAEAGATPPGGWACGQNTIRWWPRHSWRRSPPG